MFLDITEYTRLADHGYATGKYGNKEVIQIPGLRIGKALTGAEWARR